MTSDQIASLAAAGESETLEFKETTGTRPEATMTLCAFLNQSGGQALFGVTRAGVVAGQQVSDHTVEELSAELRQIDPPAFPTPGGDLLRLAALRPDAGEAVRAARVTAVEPVDRPHLLPARDH